MKTLIAITLLTLISCTHKETAAEKFQKQTEINRIKTQKTIDSLDLEIIKLGGTP